MTIYLNGKKEELEENMTLSKLLRAKKIKPEVVVVELNDKIVARERYDNTLLKPEDKLEFVYYMGGGNREAQNDAKAQNTTKSEKIADNILALIGNTPMVRLNKVVTAEMADIFAKLEFYNPCSSVKDRICLAMIEDAEKKGFLKPGYAVIEPTSGNTGIGLAMTCAVKGYKCILTMPETMSLERIYILKSFGAEVVLTSGVEGMRGAIKKAEELSKKSRHSFMPQQFKNKANPEVHRKTTAVEILDSLDRKIDAFVAGVGTGGTITGVGEVLKKDNPSVKIIAVEPASSAVLSGKEPGPHRIQGIGAGFVPEVLNRKIIDRIIQVTDDDAFAMSKRLCRKEGLFVGISAGAACWAALKVAGELGKDRLVVTVIPDTGERYFSMEQYFES